ncbi:hypothetical protein CsatA_005474 [Cannabis sativa]
MGNSDKGEVSIHPNNNDIWVRGFLIEEGIHSSIYMAKMIQRPTQGSRINGYHPIMVVKTTYASENYDLLNEKKILDLFVSCPYIIQCYGDDTTIDFDDDGNKFVFYNVFLEYASGGTLDNFINNLPLYNESKAIKRHIKSILKGVEYIHKKGIVHCDLKPDNILLVKEREDDNYFVAKIADFELAKMANDRTNPTPPRGATFYRAPECWSKHKIQEQCSDIWAVGVIVLSMITKRRKWNDKLTRHVSKEAKDFLLNCFETNPTKRPTATMLLNHPFIIDA